VTDRARLLAVTILAPTAGGAGDALDLPLCEQRPLTIGPRIARFDFADSTEGFVAAHAARVSATHGCLVIEATGSDPYVHSPSFESSLEAVGPIAVRMVATARGGGGARWYWTTRERPEWSESRSHPLDLSADGASHSTTSLLPVDGVLTRFRLDPCDDVGKLEVDEIELLRASEVPLVVERLERKRNVLRVVVSNHGRRTLGVRLGASSAIPRTFLEPAATGVLIDERAVTHRFETIDVTLEADDLPPRRANLCWVTPEIERGRPLFLRDGDVTVEIEPDGSGALVRKGGVLLAALAPLLWRVNPGDGPPRLPVTDWTSVRQEKARVACTAGGIGLELALEEGDLVARIHADLPVEGPVVRVLGAQERALFCGLEFLERGEDSSSFLDVATDERLRYAPDPAKVTWPLMSVVTDRGTVAVTWERRDLQPVFATPNRFDGCDDHRMALRGSGDFAVRVRVQRTGDRAPAAALGDLEDSILWAFSRRTLPPILPQRGRAEQWRLCNAALAGPLSGPSGWGHCAEPEWPRDRYASFAATLFRMNGELPELPAGAELADGGSHLRNDAGFLLAHQAKRWLELRCSEAAATRSSQGSDGLWHDSGPYSRGHFEETASGLCAPRALLLLDHAWFTGDERARAAGLRALDAMRRFRTPRGAQTWELPLHAPDLLAAAYEVAAYVRGFDLSADVAWLAEARRSALRGLPFVYLWGERPIEAYATIPAFAATNWKAPCWIGLPVQWCGVVYASALVEMARHDALFPWREIARGILAAAEAMQHADGPQVGCLPDAFRLAAQQRLPASINPCALVSLRLLVDGEEPGLSVAVAGSHRFVAPFPMKVDGATVDVAAPAGLPFQVVVDGARVVDAIGGRPLPPLPGDDR